MATVVVTRRRTHGPDAGSGGPCRVIVLNDDHNTFEGVARALAEVIPGIAFEAGLRMADRIHTSGQAIVWSGHREVAELYWSELKRRGLTLAPLEE
jgi:ATP-dependent Clp protease adaptor protein ClpS